ncbi:MAG TPA: protein translocase subunit SecD [Trebonia sp.]|nr:protein translocase subunit SecD [Trebonia sp.]
MAPPSRSGSRPGRALAGLTALILIMLFSILGGQTFNPGNWQHQFKVGLGLDLSSGTEVVLKAATPNGEVPSAAAMQASVGVLENRVNGTGNSGAEVATQGSNQITVTVPGQAPTSIVQLISTTAKLAFRPVLLIEPYTGVAPTTPKVKDKATGSPSATPSASATGSSTPAATPTPSVSSTASASAKASTSDVSAKLASPTASSSPKATSTATSTSTAKPTTSPSATTSATPAATASPSASPSASSSAAATITYGNSSAVSAATMKQFNALACKPGPNATTVDDSWKKTVPGYTEDASPWDNTKSQTVSCDADGTKYVLGPAVVEGDELASVNTLLDTSNDQWVVNISLNGAGTAAFGKLTTSQYNTYYAQAQAGNQDDAALDQIGITLDGDVTSAPETDGALTSGSFQITGPQPNGFTQAEATQLYNVLKFGSLPLTFTQQSVTSISPQVGHASLVAGLLAGILGLALVVLYLFYYYRGLGIVSVSSLVIAALLAYFSVVLLSKYQNFTMSLSAIAGLVVAIGITADSFIVYFERLRDEVRDGKTLRPAVEAGWKRARRTILVSDTVSFLAAVLLYHFATSDVQGFAYTLGLTTIIDVVVVFLFTKPMVTLLAGTKFFSSGHRWSGLDPERLGAKAPWRSGRRTVRSTRTGAGRTGTGRTGTGTGTSSSSRSSFGSGNTSKEA